MKPYIHDNELFFWTVETPVGKGAYGSKPEDVSYVQWYYTLAANEPTVPPERRALYKQVRITGQCNGTDSDPLVKAIIAQQKALNHPVIDGRVSVPSGNSGAARIGNDYAFFVIRQGARFAAMFPEAWPRLDKIPGCPPIVAEVSRGAVPKLS